MRRQFSSLITADNSCAAWARRRLIAVRDVGAPGRFAPLHSSNRNETRPQSLWKCRIEVCLQLPDDRDMEERVCLGCQWELRTCLRRPSAAESAARLPQDQAQDHRSHHPAAETVVPAGGLGLTKETFDHSLALTQISWAAFQMWTNLLSLQ